MSKKTVIVVGSGASKEASLPVGVELKGIISQMLSFRTDGYNLVSGDSRIFEAIRQKIRQENCEASDINNYLSAGRHISNALPLAISIDNFLDAHRVNENKITCGKLAISRAILGAERSSKLFITQNQGKKYIDLSTLDETWYTPFFQLLTENCIFEDLAERLKQVVFIVFNYDRCIEHFLKYSLIEYYDVTESEAEKAVRSIKIYHPYGKVGSLPWLGGDPSIEFGEDPDPIKLLETSGQIRTFTEGTDPNSSEIMEIRSEVASANRLVFIGFAFHKLNLKLISPQPEQLSESIDIRCFGTTYGISESDTGVISEQLNSMFSQRLPMNFSKTTVAPFFYEFWRSLSF